MHDPTHHERSTFTRAHSVGHKIAFGNTLEHLHRKILGTDARGSPADGPFDHSTGQGYVAERRGDYYDALKVKKLKVVPLVMDAC